MDEQPSKHLGISHLLLFNPPFVMVSNCSYGRGLHEVYQPDEVCFRLRGSMKDPGFTIARASATEVPAVISLIGRVSDEYGLIFDPAEELPDLLAFAWHYCTPQRACFVLRDHEGVVGSLGIERWR